MGIKITKIEANKTRKNLLGRTVSVNRTRQGAAPVSKTRTVTSKNGGVVSSKTSYKDSESVAGKMRSNKIDKINRKQFVKNAKEGAKEGARVGGSKIDQKISANREGYLPTNVKKYKSGKTKQVTNPNTGLVTNVRRSGNVKSFVDPSTGESQVYRPRVIGNPHALKKETNAQGVTTRYNRRGNVK